MIVAARCTRKTMAFATVLVSLAGSVVASAQQPPAALAPGARVEKPTNNYWVYVGAESADLIQRIRFGPLGAVVEKTIEVGELPTEMEGPHGLIISRDGKYLHMTTGHGIPDGKYWKYELGPDTLVGPGIFLGNFPASIDVTPDGLYAISANFNLHGDMVPSTVSVVYTPTMTEVARIVTCVMPHGSRIEPSGMFQYSGCMMDDQLVIHHATGVLKHPARLDAAAVGHDARHDARHLGHRRCVDDRHGGRNHIAVQVEVGRYGVQAVRGDVDRRREVAEEDPGADERIGAQFVLPVFPVGDAVAGRHVEILAVPRDDETVGTLHLGR